jgi:hypothetical protein
MRGAISKYSFYLLLLVITSCKSNADKLRFIISSSNCYWDIRDSLSVSLGRPAYCYQFNRDGHCLYLFYNRKGKRDEYDDDDVIVPKKWELKGDSIMYIRGIQRRVISYSPDTLIFENRINRVRDTLIKNCK